MLVNREEKDGITECLYKSSNILRSEYNKEEKKLVVTFNSGLMYEYYNVSYTDYVRLEITESSGTVFNKMFGPKAKRKYEFKKLEKIDPKTLLESVVELIK